MCGFSKREPGLPPYCPIALPRPGYPAPGTRDPIDAEGRIPSTEDRARPPENAHTGYADPVCGFFEGRYRMRSSAMEG